MGALVSTDVRMFVTRSLSMLTVECGDEARLRWSERRLAAEREL